MLSGLNRGSRTLVAGFALATAAFWTTMLVDPPKSEAARAKAAPCTALGRTMGAWFDSEMNRRAFVRGQAHDAFDLKLTWFRAAQRDCARGAVSSSLLNMRALERMLVAARERGGAADD